ncbi:YHS domain-containing protein [Permianibacter sp. IMCC34836]|uniref:YHS domain-containing (seleno)protein n=1 Tax=Permianibacter fluminis TaxID=2738515 RepID=UPI0015516659|nr:YHS domain-containing (seleno)protein [Permianibacter fluminis]NQD38003.1 YHS domain-containing protein [Permianibacter fluminis]
MFNTIKKTGLAAFLALAVVAMGSGLVASAAYALDETSTASVNVEQGNVILKGYDAVAYFTQNAAVKGDKKFAVSHDGATYYFASAANMKLFAANPGKYAPQYGGFCAMGVALGKKLDVDPSQFIVHNNKLYLNVNADVFKVFTKDVDGNVAKAETNWPSLKDKAPNTL